MAVIVAPSVVKVRIFNEETEEEKIVIVERRYVELIDMIADMVDEDSIFSYKVLEDDIETIDFTR